MFFDDRMDMSGKTVAIVNPGKPESFQVGFGVEEKTLDDTVLRLEGDTLIATGIGSAQITIDDEIFDVSVTAAPISLFLLIGQSNMEGMYADPNQSIICPDGQVYATFGEHSKLNRYTAKYYAASALTGECSRVNVLGTTEYLSDFPINSLTEAGAGKRGMDSGIAYEWNKLTGEKVWVVNAAHNSASINTFQEYCANFEEAVYLFSACQDTLKREVAAGHYVVSHMGYFWCQGCSDAGGSGSGYASLFQKMHNALKKNLAADMDCDPETPDTTLEFANIILALAGWEKSGYRAGTYNDQAEEYYSTFKELEMRGHRVGQLWMGANPELPDINVVCNLGDTWVTMPDGSDGVADYFASHYENGTVDYQTQMPQPTEWYSPTTPKQLKSSIHYNQIGYNEVGIEAARNTCILLGYLGDTDEETTVRFVNWTGYEDVSEIKYETYGMPGTLVVPIVSPVYRSKTVSFTVTEGLKYEYYDLITDYSTKTGTLYADGYEESVSVVEKLS